MITKIVLVTFHHFYKRNKKTVRGLENKKNNVDDCPSFVLKKKNCKGQKKKTKKKRVFSNSFIDKGKK